MSFVAGLPGCRGAALGMPVELHHADGVQVGTLVDLDGVLLIGPTAALYPIAEFVGYESKRVTE